MALEENRERRMEPDPYIKGVAPPSNQRDKNHSAAPGGTRNSAPATSVLSKVVRGLCLVLGLGLVLVLCLGLVLAPFHEPKIEINHDEKIATCSTKGGYPKPEVTWRSGDLLEGHERTLELHETTITNETDDTYSIRSTVNITGLLKVTCTVYNPTSHQTLSATTDMTPSPPTPVFAVVCFSLSVAAALIILYCINRRCNQTKGKVSENSPPSPEDPTDSNMSGGNVHEGSVSQTGTRAVIFRSTRKSDGSVDSETNNLSTADTDAEQEKQEQSVSVKILDETNTPESDKDK
ncbi:uncharacterized protein LOC111663436 [Seriola lalandi dorsalis]|uniref:uncharacterized protein LOC111663436 n=1 Tax=Seriola lalandi dorsalis TaxID=1841481 RepID=UPI000C6F8FA5|nr:uncharacterized protein LOC111663436 [Seriola lalandi dorsalis]